MDRLDKVVGPGNWQDEYRPGPSGGVICGISIYVYEPEGACGWITKWDGAENTDFEAVKGGLSDAFKRAGVKWGIGRYLYGLEGVWVKCEQRGKSVVLKETPKLPAWALPKKQGRSRLRARLRSRKTVDPKNWDEIVAWVNELKIDLQKVKDRAQGEEHHRRQSRDDPADYGDRQGDEREVGLGLEEAAAVITNCGSF